VPGNLHHPLEHELMNCRFRLPGLHIETLCDPQQVKTEDNVRYGLERLPKKLNDSYDLIYEQISNSQYPNPELASRIMRWLICAQCQLSTDDFIAAISVDSSGQYFSPSKSNVLSICCNLVVHDSEQNTFRFAHLSVREYLERLPGFDLRTSHTIALDRCLYSLFGLVELEGSALKSYNGLSLYAREYAPTHHDELHKSSDIQPLSDSLQENLKSYFYNNATGTSFSTWIAKGSRAYFLTNPNSFRLRAMLRCLLNQDINCPIGDCEQIARSSRPQKTNTLANISLIRMLLDEGGDYNRIYPRPLAAKQGNMILVRLLLNSGAYMNSYDESLKTAFDYAVEQNNVELAEELRLRNGAAIRSMLEKLGPRESINNIDSARKTPLSFAIEYGNDDMVGALLERSAALGQRDHKGQTDLHRASKMGYELAVQLLLSHGVEVNIKNNQNETPLIVAAQGNHSRIVELLLEKGADVHHLSYLHENALHIIATKGDATGAALLLDHGAEVNFRNYRQKNALHLAAQNGSTALVQMLLNRRANVAAKDLHGNTALQIAAANGHAAVVSLLLQQVEDPEVRRSGALAGLNGAIDGGQPGVVKMLLKAQVDLKSFQKHISGAILGIGDRVRSSGYASVTELLLDSWTNIDAQDYRGQTIVHQPTMSSYNHLLEILLQRHPKIETRDDNGEAPLHIAARDGSGAAVQLLLKAGAEVNAAKPVSGHTALHVAAEAGHLKIVRMLVDAGADFNAELSGGETPLHLAAEKGHNDIFTTLYEFYVARQRN
jgi:ankyrin repeat protein